MSDYYALSGAPLPAALHGADAEYSIRPLSDRERLSVEDYFFSKNFKISLNPETTAVIVPQSQTANATMEDFAVLVEFALGILTVSGFQAITTVATLNASNCSDALQRSYQKANESPKFPKRLEAVAQPGTSL